ncbi:hypothetical protein OMA37_002179 [Vibrio fluvialis]|uniref:hypothetical protein n=1 Tax=Vibrio fluvialis TaxID=676 RepID=UPI001C9CFEDD|nr:hypothetical protein [Vibrio fluvialis]EKO3390390.1 hypothetical protein [Vibrio fluvialis]EKO3401942.1 hypothetical protein [Vibrio fluvialis]ELG2041957.1 hypothetical protein [Vibrio fluvialis]MBY7806871.1 hypothetical protein [Vibrio fluvialis]MBY7944679.1 hypothetical protein [Vibrio fluvialis]
MGLVTNIEHWPMSAAIALATEGVKANYNPGVGGGGFGAADREIGSKLDGAKVLAALERIKRREKHLVDWSLFAYASPGWNANSNKERLIKCLMNDWVIAQSLKGVTIQKRTFQKFSVIVPIIAGGMALEQLSGPSVQQQNDHPVYLPLVHKAHLIALLVDYDCQQKGENSEGFKKKRTRYYQTHWERWEEHIECIRTILVGYDVAAQVRFRAELENKMGTN